MKIRIQDLVIEVPELLDGARVLFVAPATPGQTGFDYATGDRRAICYFAIAAYSGNEPGVYLFGVSSSHEVVCDSDHESPADAMRTSFASGFTKCAFQSICAPLKSRWLESHFSAYFPLAHLMRSAYPEYWFRIHSLPDSKRWPESDDERAIVFDRLSRFGTALLGRRTPCLIVQSRFNGLPCSKDLLPSLDWKPIRRVKESDGDYWDSWAAHTTWNPDELREVLLAIAEDREEQIAFVSPVTDCVFVPYDGGADGFSFDKERLRKLAEEFSAWTSAHQLGL